MTPGRHVGRADGAEQDGVEVAQLLQHVVAEDLAVAQVAGAAEVEVDRVDRHAGGAHHLQGLGGDLRTDPVATDDCNAMCHRAATGARRERRRRPTWAGR